MNYSLTHWTLNENTENLLFFAQRLLELSYNKSDFKEKNLKISTLDLIDELLNLLEFQTDKGEDGITHDFEILLSELSDSVKTDDVIKKILGDKKEIYLASLVKGMDIKILKNTLEVLKLKINPDKYYEETQEIIKTLISNNKNKDKLYQATTRLFEFLTWYGYQQGTIYHLLNIHFFDKTGTKTITSPSDINDFFNFFDLEEKEFEVVFVASKLYEEIKDSCERLGLFVYNTRPHIYNPNLENKFYSNNKNNKSFIVLKEVRAVDYLHAMKVAEKRVSLVSDLFVVFHHTRKPWYSNYCLVYKHDKRNVVSLNKPGNIMASKNGDDFSYAKDIFPIFLRNFSLESDSFNRFNRGVELHALSLETSEFASQILNFWICLEALLITEKGKTHISAVIDVIELIVNRYCFREKLNGLATCIKHWDKDYRVKLEDSIPQHLKELDDEEFIAALSCVEEYKEYASLLLQRMTNAPLLRFKFMLIVKNMQDQNNLKKTLTHEIVRATRDVRRIYRARNKIVHQGNINEHNEFIAEMAHYYLDLVLFCIIERKIYFNDIRSIDNLVNELRISKQCHEKYLRECSDRKLTPSNYIGVLFGSQH